MLERPPRLETAAVVGVLCLVTLIFFIAATQPPRGPRLSRRARLVDLIRAEDRRVRELRRAVEDLRGKLLSLEEAGSTRGRNLTALRQDTEALAPYAGLGPVAGPGLRIVLRDSKLRAPAAGDPNDLVIHEQDLQAVVNALWSSGAEAVAINGERVTSATAIRCVGNTLLLHGSLYGPPYSVAAVGDPRALRAGLQDDRLVERFRVVVDQFRLGFDVEELDSLALPAFRGSIATRFAEVA